MSFLLPYIKKRSTTSISVPVFDGDDNVKEDDFVDDEMAQKWSSDVGQPMTVTFPTTPDVNLQTAGSLSTVSSQAHFNSQPTLTKKRKKRTSEISDAILMKYILDNKKTSSQDDIGQFMAGITTTLRSFPARDRAVAKAQIFGIVSQMEIEILNRPSMSNSRVSTPSSSTTMPDTIQDFYEGCLSLNTEEQIKYEHIE
ncbi:hypothetical protein HHI36_013052 [Cryptolaemus montrouzieri]